MKGVWGYEKKKVVFVGVGGGGGVWKPIPRSAVEHIHLLPHCNHVYHF